MTKVKINRTPSEAIVQEANQTYEVKDARGRVITLKRAGILAQYRLVAALGDLAQNQTYMAMCFPLLCVAAIDGEPVMPPRTHTEIEALIQRLDDAGVAAIQEGIEAHFGDAPQSEDEVKAELKK